MKKRGEGRLGVGGEEARGGEVELGVRRDGLFDAAVTELGCDGEVVEPSSEPVAVVDELNDGDRVMVSRYILPK